MKKFNINIDPKLENVEITVQNGAEFTRACIQGEYKEFRIEVSEYDLDRIKRFAVKYGNDNSSNHGSWYAHCIGFSMGLFVQCDGNISINTYKPYGKSAKKKLS